MSKKPAVRWDVSIITEEDIYLFNEGSHFRLYEKLGAHVMTNDDGERGVYFAVWAPDAEFASVIGDFNYWNNSAHQLRPCGSSGIWHGFIPNAELGMKYKFHIRSRYNNHCADKADPYALYTEKPPLTASVVTQLNYEWSDSEWMQTRGKINAHDAPMSIYEMHIGSWMLVPKDGNRPLTYRELAPKLAEYVNHMGFTHVEFMPVMEHPFSPSWGYQITGFFAPTSRFGMPQDFMYLIDYLHQQGIGVILDWVPSHFPTDGNGLGYFDGTHLYEHADPKQGFHPDWGSLIFNYERNEVKSFLYSNAFFWLEKYHVDGLRVDAVASMLYLDYSREDGEWIPNKYGGKENLGAIEFLRRINHEIYAHYPDVQTIAEESTSWPMVSRPTYIGGLGFGYKWDMGWMHDCLKFFSCDPVFRKYHHNELTFRMLYAFTENFCLPLSHDEVVHGKGSMISKMPGDLWQKFANLRLLYGYMYGQPGKKLLFMGAEIGQWSEWSHETSLEWHLLDYDSHKGLQLWVKDLNHFYRNEQGLHTKDNDPNGFEWVDCSDTDNSIISFIRKGVNPNEYLLFALNFTPVPRYLYRIGVPVDGHWKEVLNSDAEQYGGSGQGNFGGAQADHIPCHHHYYSLNLTVPPLGCVVFKNSLD